MADKHIMLDLDDSRIADLADVISNKTSKKIISYLAENEASEAEIARDLKLPANTINYNIKKLVNVGLIESAKEHFWSVKGRKILKYKVANKKVVISPKSLSDVKSILGAFAVTAIGAFLIKIYTGANYAVLRAGEESGVAVEKVMEAGASADYAVGAVNNVTNVLSEPAVWSWFLLGGIFALIIFMILNYRRLK